ncbi:MAG: Lin0512 family protein [Dehalococcoidia bacterium]
MPAEPWVLEFGMGVDVHGEDSTTAARRAVSDAIRHSSLPLLSKVRAQGGEMLVDVVIGVPNAASVDLDVVKGDLPDGTVTVTAVEGGLKVGEGDTPMIAVAHITVRVNLPE